jgi:hypothetical protein
MKTALYFLIIGLAAFLLTSYSPNQDVSGSIGDVKYSLLAPTEFMQVNGPGWLLLDGCDTASSRRVFDDPNYESDHFNNSVLHLKYLKALPDGRGVFLRGMNLDRDIKQGDAGGNRDVGFPQADEFKSHTHLVEGPATTGDIVGTATNFYNENVRRRDRATTTAAGGDETRPRNISIYIYVKVN